MQPTFLSSGMGAAPIPDDKKTLTLISMEPIHDDKLKQSRCHLVETSPNK